MTLCAPPWPQQVDGGDVPYELAYSRWLTDWVSRLAAMPEDGASTQPSPSARPPSEELLIAARGQHVMRWTSARSSYPEVRQRGGAKLLDPKP